MPPSRPFAPSLAALSLVGGAFLLAAPAARAEPPPFTIGTQPAWFLLGGLSTGYTVAGTDERGPLVGAELSVARLHDQRFVGFYAESAYDFAVDSAVVGGGLEVGWKVIAVDAGVLARHLQDDAELGVAGRLCGSVGLLSLCGRYARFDADADRNVFQVGLLLKLPLLSPSGGY